ncbi:hypothetical protein H257_07972 [Aphanomyces astaci]|uniref:Uncharacterized protein n=2 Tax=Aphanomyces astaci TaxID=112090 RepID=W4GH97_APHAT|nr:hypothetical protein H257_07972 [Aphanomyces astaci]ETV78429.1 hypothetical protein H257_07972 [Aphanomyces astaci]|eukprot:XP_009832010.1 hypothetical protein H257_07972 [Aphanomyces astaci]
MAEGMTLKTHEEPVEGAPTLTRQDSTATKVKKLEAFHRLNDEGFGYLGDNTYIHHGYRLHYTMKECVVSLFEVHNETLNVWTHMVGSLIFMSLLVLLYMQVDKAVHSHHTLESPHHVHLVNLPYMSQGHHTLRLFTTHSVMDATERALVQTLSLHGPPRDFLESASVLFNSTLADLVHDSSDPVEVLLLKQDLLQLQDRLAALADHAWLNRHVYGHLASLQDKVRARLTAIEHSQHQDNIRHGIQAITDVLNVLRFDLDHHHVPVWPVSVFIGSAIVCLSCSALFHLLYVVGPAVYAVMSRLDYSGISILISGSFVPVQYYGFYCHDTLRWFYLTTTLVLATLTFAMAMMPFFAKEKFLVLRTCTFISFGCFGAVPVVHMALLRGFHDDQVQVILYPMLWEGLFYIGGAMIYMSRIPERFYPGRFDVLFGSHQIWHVCVVMAALVHFHMVTNHFEWRWNHPCHADISLS